MTSLICPRKSLFCGESDSFEFCLLIVSSFAMEDDADWLSFLLATGEGIGRDVEFPMVERTGDVLAVGGS